MLATRITREPRRLTTEDVVCEAAPKTGCRVMFSLVSSVALCGFPKPVSEDNKKGNYSGMLIGLPIAIMYFLARKITAEGAEEREST